METSQQKKRFTNGIWVTGAYKNVEIVGRTYQHNGDNCVALVTESGETLSVPFDAIINIKRFSFVDKTIPRITSAIQKKKRFTAIEKHIVETLSSINRKRSK